MREMVTNSVQKVATVPDGAHNLTANLSREQWQAVRLVASAVIAACDVFLGPQAAPAAPLSLVDAANEFLVAKARAGRRDRYLVELRHVVGLFCAEFGQRSPDTITTDDVERWTAKPGWKPKTRLNHLRDIQTFFAWLVRRGIVARNPAAHVERPSVEASPPGIHTPAQVRAVLSAAASDPDVRRRLAVQYFAGLRPAEAERLTEANLLPRYVEVGAAQSKTRKRRLVSINDTLRAWLDAGGKLPVVNYTRRWRAVRDAAGVPWPHDVTRHSFASYHLAAGASADRTAHELGHAGAGMLFRHYREVVTAEAAAEFWALRPGLPQKATAGCSRPG